MNKTLPFQLSLDKPIPELVRGGKEYRQGYELLKNIDYLFQIFGLDNLAAEQGALFAKKRQAEKALKTYSMPKKLTYKKTIRAQQLGVFGLRLVVLRRYKNLSYREMSEMLCLTELYQWFCKIDRFITPVVASKSKLNEIENMFTDSFLHSINEKITKGLIQKTGEEDEKEIRIKKQIKIDDCFFDPFCLEAKCHYPTDWVLFRDAAKTLTLSITKIRKFSKNRMDESPEKLMTKMNNLCIEMTAYKGRKDGKKKRKKIFRSMKTLIKNIANHARRHIEKLYINRAHLEISEEKLFKFNDEINLILTQLSTAIECAHKKIISEKTVANKEKIMSFYYENVNSIHRKKIGKKYEYGNKVSLMENGDGLIVDWNIAKVGSPSDTKLFKASYDRVVKKYGAIESITTDRGCQSKANSKHIKEAGVFDAMCPRNVTEMKERRKDPRFCKLQKRRSSTEARISILKRFTGDKSLSKSFEHRKQQLSISVITHNLWKVANMMIDESITRTKNLNSLNFLKKKSI